MLIDQWVKVSASFLACSVFWTANVALAIGNPQGPVFYAQKQIASEQKTNVLKIDTGNAKVSAEDSSNLPFREVGLISLSVEVGVSNPEDSFFNVTLKNHATVMVPLSTGEAVPSLETSASSGREKMVSEKAAELREAATSSLRKLPRASYVYLNLEKRTVITRIVARADNRTLSCEQNEMYESKNDISLAGIPGTFKVEDVRTKELKLDDPLCL